MVAMWMSHDLGRIGRPSSVISDEFPHNVEEQVRNDRSAIIDDLHKSSLHISRTLLRGIVKNPYTWLRNVMCVLDAPKYTPPSIVKCTVFFWHAILVDRFEREREEFID